MGRSRGEEAGPGRTSREQLGTRFQNRAMIRISLTWNAHLAASDQNNALASPTLPFVIQGGPALDEDRGGS